MINTQTQIDSLIDLAVIQRTELKQLIESLPQLRDHLSSEIERNLEEIEPAIRSELEQFVAARALDTQAKTSAELSAKLDTMARNLESTTAAKYSVLMAERAENANLLAKAEARIEDAASMLSHAVKEIVTDELSRFPRAGEIDQLRKEFAEPRGLNPRGRWQVGETYNKLDLVSYNGDSYVSNTDGNSEKPSRSSAAWTLSAARGNGGAGGGVTSMTDLVPVPANGEILIGNGSAFVNATLTAGTGISISNGPGSITINATDGNITLDDGTAAAPSLNFTNEPTTGLFRASANVMGFAVAGVSRATMTTTGVTVTGTITPSGSLHAAAGSVSNPSIAFNADQNTGLYNIGADNIGVAVGGAKVLDVASTGLTVTGALGATSLTAPATTPLTLAGGSTGASLVLGNTAGAATFNRSITVSLTPSGNPELILSSVTGTPIVSLFGTGPTAAVDPFVAFPTAGNLRFGTATGVGAAGASEKARVTNTGNLLIGGTTDITGSGGLKVYGTTAASSTASGALQVAGGVGVAGAGFFGGNISTNQVALSNTSSGFLTMGSVGNGVIGFGVVTNKASSSYGAFIKLNSSSLTSGRIWNVSSTGDLDTPAVVGSLNFYDETSAVSPFNLTGGALATGSAKVTYTTSASSSTVGALTIGNGTAATNVAIGGGNVNAGGTGTFGGALITSGTGVNVIGGIGARLLINGPVDDATFDAIIQGGRVKLVGGNSNIGSTGNIYFDAGGGGALYMRTGVVSISNSTASTGVGTGALQVAGGIYAGAASVLNGFTSFNGGASIQGSTAAYRYLMFATGATNNGANAGRRYNVGVSTTAESGSNVGSDYEIRAYDDAGSPLRGGPDLLMTRSTGAATFAGAVTVSNKIIGVQAGAAAAAIEGARLTNTTTTGSVYLNFNETNSTATPAYLIRYGSTHASSANILELAATGTGAKFRVLPAMSISDTTAGSAGAGALVVSGGLATGAASYFGGNVTVAGTGVSTIGASGARVLVNGATDDTSTSLQVSGNSSLGSISLQAGPTTYANYKMTFTAQAADEAYIINFGGYKMLTGEGFNTPEITKLYSNNTLALTLSSTQAATFAGLIFPQQAVTASAPTYVKGAIYFDTTLNKLRVGGATAWETITSV